MGVLIVVLAAVLIGELIRRAFLTSDTGEIAAVSAPLAFDMPADSRIVGLAGSQSHIAIHAVLADGRHRVYLVDPAAGQITGVIGPESSATELSD